MSCHTKVTGVVQSVTLDHRLRGCILAAASQNYTSSDDKTPHDSEPSYKPDDVTTHEVVEMSKLPDAHQPSDDEIPAIERSDWPAPPHPAAAYPELRMCLTCCSIMKSFCFAAQTSTVPISK